MITNILKLPIIEKTKNQLIAAERLYAGDLGELFAQEALLDRNYDASILGKNNPGFDILATPRSFPFGKFELEVKSLSRKNKIFPSTEFLLGSRFFKCPNWESIYHPNRWWMFVVLPDLEHEVEIALMHSRDIIELAEAFRIERGRGPDGPGIPYRLVMIPKYQDWNIIPRP